MDTKVSSAALARRLEADVIAGPTTQARALPACAACDSVSKACRLVASGMTGACGLQDGIPPFRWTPAFNDVEHRGQPVAFEYQTFERQAPDMPAFSKHAAAAFDLQPFEDKAGDA